MLLHFFLGGKEIEGKQKEHRTCCSFLFLQGGVRVSRETRHIQLEWGRNGQLSSLHLELSTSKGWSGISGLNLQPKTFSGTRGFLPQN